jgi:hypothetical protein
LEFDGLDEYDANSLCIEDILAENVSIELCDDDSLDVVVNDPWFVEVDDLDGLFVVLGDADKDG